MILEAICKVSNSWMKQMDEKGTPIYEYDEEWPVTIEIKNQADSSVEARVLGKGSELNMFIIKCAKGYKLQWRDMKWTHHINKLDDFTNDEAIKVIDQTDNAFEKQTIATAVRAIGKELDNFKE